MSALWVLTRQRLNDVLRSRSSVVFTFLLPVALVVIVGLVFMHGHPFEVHRVALVGDVAARELDGYEEVRLEPVRSEAEAIGKLKARVVSAVLVRRDDARRELLVGPRDRLFGAGVAAALRGDVSVRVLDLQRWGYVHYLFSGLVTLGVMVAALFATGYQMALYRQNRFLRKLATTPLRKSTFVAALVGARGGLIAVQALLMLVAAVLVFDVHVTVVSLLWFIAITVLGVLAFMGIGFVLACVIRNEDLITDVIGAVNLPLVLLSEVFFPLDVLPRPLALVGEALPSTWMVRLLRSVLLYDVTDAATLGGGALVLAGWAAVTFAISLVVFRWT